MDIGCRSVGRFVRTFVIKYAAGRVHPLVSQVSMRQALVYLPGMDGSGRLLHRQPRLFEDYEVHCVAYPHHRPATYEELADLGAAALESSSGRRPGVVLAESFGGAVALTLALRRPDRVERLVLVNTFAFYPRRAVIEFAAWLGPLLPAKPSLRAGDSACRTR
jgi:pimeloyl-ACP methyl ester carboxylesterase